MRIRIKENIMPVIVWSFIIIGMLLFTVVNKNFTLEKSWMTLLMLAIMGGAILGAQFGGINKLINIIKALKITTNRIQDIAKDTNQDVWEVIRKKDDFFENDKLNKIYKEYTYEMDRLYREHEDNVQCDVADYINDSSISEVTHGHLLDQLPGVMTGLGILGTFIGLAVGLNGFNNNGVDEMIASITPLIDGIKVAFYTSIYGVVLSLAFNLYYKWVLGKLTGALDEFYDVFYKNVVPIPSNDLANQLLHYQQSQASSMEQFAETISVQLAKSFEAIAAPTFNQMGETMSVLSNKMESTMNTLSDQISNKQKESMGEIVDTFLREMNQSLGGSFENLKETIETLCTGQETTAEKVNKLIDHLCSTIENIDHINDSSKQTVIQLEEYCAKLNAFQSGVNLAYEHIEQQESMFEHITQQQTECLTVFSSHEVALVNSITELSEKTKIMESILNSHVTAISESTSNQIDAINEIYGTFKKDFSESLSAQMNMNKQIQSELSEQLSNTTLELKTVANSFDSNVRDSINKTFEQFDANLSEIALCLSGTISEINETSQNIPKSVRSTFVTMQEQLNDYIKCIDEMRQLAQNATIQMMESTNQLMAVAINETKEA